MTTAAEDTVPSLEEMGTATEGLGLIFAGAGTESENFGGALTSMNDFAVAAQGGLDATNTSMETFGESSGTASEGASSFGGAVTSII